MGSSRAPLPVVLLAVAACIRPQQSAQQLPPPGYPQQPNPQQPYPQQPPPPGYPQQPYPQQPYPQQPYPQQPYPQQPTPPQPAPPRPAPTASTPQDPWATLLGQVLTTGPALPPGFQLPGWIPGWPAPQPSGSSAPPPAPQPAPASTLPPVGARALDLASTINAYRQQNGLPPVPVTRALTFVAETHVRDLQSSPKRPGCNGHSWTDRGKWSACCYTPDHAQAKCMWSKPAELTPYASTGFEIAIGEPGQVSGVVLDSRRALELWKSSPLHHDVILNRATWQGVTWRAMGAGIVDSHAAVWFAKDPDPSP